MNIVNYMEEGAGVPELWEMGSRSSWPARGPHMLCDLEERFGASEPQFPHLGVFCQFT
jgi:hypothetical protein